MLKSILAGTIVLAVAGSTVVYAQQRGPRPDNFQRGQQSQQSVEDLQPFADARLAALRAGLSLTAEQEANWPAFETAARELQKLRIDRVRAATSQPRNAQRPGSDFVERMRTRASAMTDMGVALKKFADAADPLYKSLDDGQKRRFTVLGRVMDPRESFAAGGGRHGFRGGLDLHHHFGRGFRNGPGRDGGDRGGRDVR